MAKILYRLIFSSYVMFFGSMVVSGEAYYRGKPFRLRDGLISGLLSAADNPRGYRIASIGVAVSSALLLPVAWLFFLSLTRRHRALAVAGSLLFGLGPLSGASMMLFTHDINELHVYLAFASYIFMTCGLVICLGLEASPAIRRGGMQGVLLGAALLFLLGVLVFLIYLLFTPDYFNDKSLLRNAAFCEWTLCCILAASISGLAMMLTRRTR